MIGTRIYRWEEFIDSQVSPSIRELLPYQRAGLMAIPASMIPEFTLPDDADAAQRHNSLGYPSRWASLQRVIFNLQENALPIRVSIIGVYLGCGKPPWSGELPIGQTLSKINRTSNQPHRCLRVLQLR